MVFKYLICVVILGIFIHDVYAYVHNKRVIHLRNIATLGRRIEPLLSKGLERLNNIPDNRDLSFGELEEYLMALSISEMVSELATYSIMVSHNPFYIPINSERILKKKFGRYLAILNKFRQTK